MYYKQDVCNQMQREPRIESDAYNSRTLQLLNDNRKHVERVEELIICIGIALSRSDESRRGLVESVERKVSSRGCCRIDARVHCVEYNLLILWAVTDDGAKTHTETPNKGLVIKIGLSSRDILACI